MSALIPLHPRGRPRTDAPRQRQQLSLPPEDLARWRALAQADDRTLSAWVRGIVNGWIANNATKGGKV